MDEHDVVYRADHNMHQQIAIWTVTQPQRNLLHSVAVDGTRPFCVLAEAQRHGLLCSLAF